MNLLLKWGCMMLPITLFANNQAVFPTPEKVEYLTGKYHLSKKITINADERLKNEAGYLRSKLSSAIESQVSLQNGSTTSSAINLVLDKNDKLSNEGYQLEISSKGITISGAETAGVFYGIQSLLQLMPAEILANREMSNQKIILPMVKITDVPRYKWRSYMLDSGRQFHTVDFIKRYLDLMAMHKINVFHWHLTEDEGWRVESKLYPKLHEIGSKVAKGKEQQGYYTQEQIKEVVSYAKKRHIAVVPEIDVPGHSEAAMLSYPELTCFGKVDKVGRGHSPNIYCGGKESTYKFLENLMNEICDLFPSEYIHIGGDEAPKGNWNKCPDCKKKIKQNNLKNSHELQIYLTNFLADVLAKRGRKAICWGDVVRSAGPPMRKNVVVHWWRRNANGDLAVRKAAEQQLEIICNPNINTYLNFPVTPWKGYGKGRTFDIKTTYNANGKADSKLPVEAQKYIIGWGACQWTDYNVLQKTIDKLAFPRLTAVTELMWSRAERTGFDTFYKNLKEFHYPRLKAVGVDIGPGLANEITPDFSWD